MKVKHVTMKTIIRQEHNVDGDDECSISVCWCFRRGGSFGPTSSSSAGGDAGGVRRCRNAGQVDKRIQNRFDYIAAFESVSVIIMDVAVLM